MVTFVIIFNMFCLSYLKDHVVLDSTAYEELSPQIMRLRTQLVDRVLERIIVLKARVSHSDVQAEDTCL